MRGETKLFAKLMDKEKDLKQAEKGESWRTMSINDLWKLLWEEFREVEGALKAEELTSMKDIIKEISHLANIASFIMDREGKR